MCVFAAEQFVCCGHMSLLVASFMHFAAGAERYCHPADDMVLFL